MCRYIQLAQACICTEGLSLEFTRCREFHQLVETIANTTTNNNLQDDAIVDNFLVVSSHLLGI